MKKRLLTLFLVLVMVLGLSTTVFAGPVSGGGIGGYIEPMSIDSIEWIYYSEDYAQN